MTLHNFEEKYPVGSYLKLQLPGMVSKYGSACKVLEIHHDGPTDKDMVMVRVIGSEEYVRLTPEQILVVE